LQGNIADDHQPDVNLEMAQLTRSFTSAAEAPPVAMEPSIAEFLDHGYQHYLELVKRADDHVENRNGADTPDLSRRCIRRGCASP
jgi:hypothetical protein